METKVAKPRKAFTVIVDGEEYDVYGIDGREHEGLNGEPKTWWLYHAERLPEGLTPPADSENFVPYSYGINRMLWDLRFTQHNYTKEKWSETSFRNSTRAEMWCNGKKVYAFTTTGTQDGLAFAMAKVQYLQVMLSEHSFNFFDPHSENGRKIFWYGLPATVKVWRKEEPWEIGIVPDYTDGLTKEQWWKEYRNRRRRISASMSDDHKEDERDDEEEDREDEQKDFINWGDALSDQHINWHR